MNTQHSHSSKPLWLYKGLLLLAAAIWGLGTVVIKSTVDVFPPLWLVGVRFGCAGLVLGAVTFGRIRPYLNSDHVRAGVLLGVLLFLSYWTNSLGLTDTTASNSSFLTTLYVVIVPFLALPVLHKRPTFANVGAALLCIAGVGCVAYNGAAGFSLRFGDLVTMASALFLALHVLYTSKLAPHRNMTALTVIQFLVAGALGAMFGLASGNTPDFANLTIDTWISIGYLALFASAIALFLQNVSLAHVPPAPASLFLSTESVFGVTFSMLFLEEQLTASLGLGFALIFAGILISEYFSARSS